MECDNIARVNIVSPMFFSILPTKFPDFCVYLFEQAHRIRLARHGSIIALIDPGNNGHRNEPNNKNQPSEYKFVWGVLTLLLRNYRNLLKHTFFYSRRGSSILH